MVMVTKVYKVKDISGIVCCEFTFFFESYSASLGGVGHVVCSLYLFLSVTFIIFLTYPLKPLVYNSSCKTIHLPTPYKWVCQISSCEACYLFTSDKLIKEKVWYVC